MGITPETIPKDMTALERLCVSEVRVDKHYGALTSDSSRSVPPEKRGSTKKNGVGNSNGNASGQQWSMPKLWVGQTLNDQVAQKAMDPSASWFAKHRRLVALVFPGLVANVIWWSYAFTNPSIFDSFTGVVGEAETPNWYMCITMAFGSMFAGVTSEGGGSVAFPVLTLAFGILPRVARDFSFMIQSAGMTAAAATIATMQVQVEMYAIVYATIGGVCGLVLGLEKIDPLLEPAYAKMIFVCTWATFAYSLFWLNRLHDRRVFKSIPSWNEGVIGKVSVPLPAGDGDLTLSLNWKACALLLCGFVGGIFSSISGSGIDICTFSILTLLFRVSEKIATPTSVILMAINTLVGFMYRQFVMGGMGPDVTTLFAVCVPIVVIGAPLGSLLGSHLHRLVMASLIYLVDGTQLISALVILKPWTTENTDTPLVLCIMSVAILVLGSLLFAALAKFGSKLLEHVEERERLAPVNAQMKAEAEKARDEETLLQAFKKDAADGQEDVVIVV